MSSPCAGARKARRTPPERFRRGSSAICPRVFSRDYFSELLIVLNLVFKPEPMPWTIAMIASAMPAAIRAYSIAVAPD